VVADACAVETGLREKLLIFEGTKENDDEMASDYAA
jgi:hypothetical protein